MKNFIISTALAVVVTIFGIVNQVSAFLPSTGRLQPLLKGTTVSTKVFRPHHNRPFLASLTSRHLSQIDADSPKVARNTKHSLFLTSLALLSLATVAWKRQAIMEFLSFVKDKWLLTTLNRLSEAGPTGLIVYTLFFLLWEMTFGITTPVETAAGMAFGAVPGIIASGSGKFLGSLFTFLLARYKFTEVVRKKMENNELLSLMEESIQETPFRVALLCRFSPLPEFIKNAGIAVMPVPKRWFILSLLLHGFSFTCLWTCMGAETARVLRGLEPSSTLKILMTGATWIGFGAPVMIGLWIKSLRDKQTKRREKQLKSSQVPVE